MSRKLTKSNFYLPEPRAPGRDVRAWILVSTSFVIALGFCLFAVLSYSFEEMQNMPSRFRTDLVIYGAWALAVGCEFSTPVACFEIYRKLGTEDHSPWDYVALSASIFSTLMVLFIATSNLLNVDAEWPEIVRTYGPILLILAAGADGYATFIETGLYLRRFDRRYKEWQAKYREAATSADLLAAGIPVLTPVRPSASDEDTQEFYITRPLTDLERLLAEGKTPEQIAVALGKPLPIVHQLITGEEE